LADVVAGLLVLVDAAGILAGAEIGIADCGIGQQVPDDHQDGAGDGEQGLELAAALDDAPVALSPRKVSVLAASEAGRPTRSTTTRRWAGASAGGR